MSRTFSVLSHIFPTTYLVANRWFVFLLGLALVLVSFCYHSFTKFHSPKKERVELSEFKYQLFHQSMKLTTAALCLASALLFSEQQTTTAFGLMRSRFASFGTTLALTSTRQRRPLATATGISRFLHSPSSSQTCPTRMSSSLSTRGGSALNSAVAEAVVDAAPVEHFRLDYQPLPHIVSNIQMNVQIFDGTTTVTSNMTIRPNVPEANNHDMILDGDETCVKLLQLALNGRDLLEGTDYELTPGKLILKASALSLHNTNTLTTVVQIVPEDNTQLSGLYKSGPMYCSQCEAMGFRRITYYPDRPDNMAVFDRVRLEANKESFPILLSNGNLVEQGDMMDGRHYAVWSDPYPKPSYLFCVVAGKLGSIQDTYTTTSGRHVQLEIFSEAENVAKLQYAMESLKRSMKWDEDTFGLEYDLGIYNIVAVNDFNMGAMENKGLNVFNTAYVLADPATATDGDYERVEGVIGHEYFHNVRFAVMDANCRNH